MGVLVLPWTYFCLIRLIRLIRFNPFNPFNTLELSSGWGRGQPPVFPAPKMSCSKKYMSNGTLVGQNGKEEYYQYFNKYAITMKAVPLYW